MNVADLYLIVKELREVSVLQANMLEVFAAEGAKSTLYMKQQDTHARLEELLESYEKYDI